MCSCRYGGQRLTLAVSLRCSPHCFLRKSHWTWSPSIWLEYLASKLWGSSVFSSLALGLQDAAVARLSMGARDLNSGLGAYVESTN